MATDIVGGLFGINPSALQRARQEAAFNEDYKSVQLTPIQQGNLMLRQGARALGEGLAPLLGGQDPEMAKATMARQLASQFDITSAEGLRQYASALAQNGAPDLAQLAIQRADQLTTTALSQGKTIAETIRAGREKLPEIGQLQTYRDQLIAEFGPNDPRVLEVNENIKGLAKGRGVTITNAPPDTRGKAFEAADPEALKEYRKESRAAAGQLSLISQARENLPGAVVGQGLPAIIRGINAQLAPLGINTEQVAKSRNLEQALKSIIAQGIKQYGANPSTVDLQFAVQAATNIQDPMQAIKATLDYLETRAKTSVSKADAAEQYLLKNQNLAGFEKQWTEQVTGPKPTAGAGRDPLGIRNK